MAATYRLTFDASGNPTRIKDDFAAAAAPDANDDLSTGGWVVGSLQYVPTTDTLYIAESVGTGTAVWTVVGAPAQRDLTTQAPPNLSVSGAYTVDREDGATHDLTLTGNATLTPDDTNPPGSGFTIDLRILIRQDGTGGWTLAWGGTIAWAGGSAPVMPTAADALLTVGLLSVDDAVTWLGYVVEDAISGIEVAEADGTPDVADVTRIEFSGATVTDDTGGQVTVTVDAVTAAAVAAVGYWAPLVDSGTGDLIRDSSTNEVIVAFVPTP